MVLIRRSLSDADSGIDAREAKCPGARGSGICQAGVPALQKCLLAAMFLAQVALGSGQNVAQTGTSPGQETRARQGVVVENVASGSEGAKAGLQAGDVLLAWSRSGEGGRIESPFDLTDVETEQAPRGPVTVEGRRGTEKQSWTMGPSIWGVKARPNLNATPLRSYEEGQELTRSGKVDEAALVWRKAASQLDSSAPGWLRSWFLAQAADKLVTEHRWKEADEAYQSAVEAAPGTQPVISGQLFQAWAVAYQQRSDWANAEKYFQQAITESRKSGGERLVIASNLTALGTISLYRGDLDKAEQYFRQGFDLREKLAPGSLAVAASLNSLGLAAWQRGDLAKADENHRQALDIRQRLARGSLAVAGTLNNLGLVAYDRGDLPKAEDYYNQALDILQKLAPGGATLASALGNLGLVAWQQGDLAKAEDDYRQALDIQQRLLPGSLNVAASLTNLGIVAYERKDLAQAQEYFRQALEIREKLAPRSLDVAASLNNLGSVALQQGDLAQAEEYHRRALDIEEKIAPGSLDVARALYDLGKATFERGDLAKAEGYYRQALEVQEKLAPGSIDVATSLDDLGKVARQRGEPAKAEAYYRQALAIKERLAPDGLGTADTIQGLGDLTLGSGDREEAAEYYRHALAIREKLAPESKEYAELLAAVASILRNQRQLDAAAQLYERSLSALEKQIARLGGSQEIRSQFRAQHSDIYKSYIDLLLAQKKPDRAFEALERFRARILLEMLVTAHVDIRQGADPSLLKQERALQESLAAKSDRRLRLLGEKKNEKQLAAFSKEIQDLDKQHEEIQERLRLSSPGYAALTQPQPLTLNQVQQLLDTDTLLLEYALGVEHSYLWVVGRDASSVYELPKRTEIETAARQLYGSLSRKDNGVGAGHSAPPRDSHHSVMAMRLSRMILGSAAGLLQQRRRLLVVSDGALEYIPFGALPAPYKPSVSLLAEHEVVELPSASTLAILRHQIQDRSPAPKLVAVLADPVFDEHDDRLRLGSNRLQVAPSASPRSSRDSQLERSARDTGIFRNGVFSRLLFSRQEAEAIRSIAGQNKAMEALDFDASKTNAMNAQLKDYRIVHLATHGLLNSENPELSGLVFSLVDRDGRQQDGFLRLHDVYNLELHADLVVMSACETALGKQIEGEGVIGLTRGFMYAGAARVVSSLWNVNDKATSELMRKFYEGMMRNGQTPSAALRSAQMWMRGQPRWQDPYYWAGFVLQGDWR